MILNEQNKVKNWNSRTEWRLELWIIKCMCYGIFAYAYYWEFQSMILYVAHGYLSHSPGLFFAHFSGTVQCQNQLGALEKIALKHAICISWLEKIGDLAVANLCSKHPAGHGRARSVLISLAGAESHCNTPWSTGEVGSSTEQTLCAAILQIESQSRWHDHQFHLFTVSVDS